MYQEDLSSPTIEFLCSFFLPLLFHSLWRLVPSSQVPVARAKLMHYGIREIQMDPEGGWQQVWE